MPVAGLPAAAETALNALLADNNVSSWKIVGEGASTVIILRHNPQSYSSAENMADSNSTHGQHFRRKPPSQIRRDQERSRQQNEQSTKAYQAGGNNSDFPFLALALDPTFGIHSHKTLDTAQPCRLLKLTENLPLLAVFSSQIISVPSFCYSQCVCVLSLIHI